jgi:hypothetical protein
MTSTDIQSHSEIGLGGVEFLKSVKRSLTKSLVENLAILSIF